MTDTVDCRHDVAATVGGLPARCDDDSDRESSDHVTWSFYPPYLSSVPACSSLLLCNFALVPDSLIVRMTHDYISMRPR